MEKEDIKYFLKKFKKKQRVFFGATLFGMLAMLVVIFIASIFLKGNWCNVLRCQTRIPAITESAVTHEEPVAGLFDNASPTIISDQLEIKPQLDSSVYTVQAGDCLWKIAESQLGDPLRWVEIYELNQDVIGGNPDLIHVDVVLQLPGG